MKIFKPNTNLFYVYCIHIHISSRINQSKTAWSLKMGPIGCPETSVKTIILHWIKFQKSADLIYSAADTWYQAGPL
jgi:hypothetical protein